LVYQAIFSCACSRLVMLIVRIPVNVIGDSGHRDRWLE
jgi:hypothetical protein